MEIVKNVDQYLQLNTNIDIKVLKGEYVGLYSSRIEDIDNKSVYISIPTNKSIPIPLAPNTEIEVYFIASTGRFSFKSFVKNKVQDKIPMLEIEKPTKINRKELRKYFRVDCRIKAKMALINFTNENGELKMKKELYDVIIKDISGGGMRIMTKAPIKENQAVEFDLSSSLGLQKEIFGKVIKIMNPDDFSGQTEAGIEFISIKENDRDKIIKYVFKRQIELRKMAN